MELKEARELAQNLKNEVEYHNKKYYDEDAPEIDDYEYDMLVKKLEEIEAQFPELLTEDSPTQSVGGDVSTKFSPVYHAVKMESLQDAFSEDEIIAFDKRVRATVGNTSYVVEPKIDGLSVAVEYKNGSLFRASTRGDGTFGEDVTENILTIKSLPKKIDKNIQFLEVRAEVYMSKKNFAQLVKKQELEGIKSFKNPRNAAAGSLRQKDASVTASRNLEILVFNIQQIEGKSFDNHKISLDFLKSLGFLVPQHSLCDSIQNVLEEIQHAGKVKDEFAFQADGAVVKVNSFEHRKKLGSTTKHPKWAIAFKYAPEQCTTELLKIEVNVGRTGILTPVGILDPVLISGSTVRRVVLHNEDYIKEKNIHVGDTVIIRKAGEIIPEVVSVLSHKSGSKQFEFPKNCPSCGSYAVRAPGEVAIRCVSTDCPAQFLRNIIHFTSRGAMNIDGLGKTTIKNLVESKAITSAADLYYLSKNEIISMERMGDKSSQNALAAIEISKMRGLDKLLFALGIRNVGQRAAKILAKRFGNINNIINATEEEIAAIDGIGEVISESVVKYFSLPQNLKLLDKLQKAGVVMTYYKGVKSKQKFSDKTFVLTGVLEKFTRDEASEMIESLGGKVVSSVSKNTSYVLCGANPGSKFQKAKNLGVNIITEEEFLNLIK